MLYRNTAFQLFGRGTAMLSGLISVPVFLHYMSEEAYGIIGVYLSMMALSGLFDFGLPVSVNRQISNMRAQGKSSAEFSGVIRSIELMIWILSLIIFALLWVSAPYIAGQWLNLVELDAAEVMFGLMLAGGAIALRFPTAFYHNCLFAFEHHGRANMVTSLASIARLIVPVVLFIMIEPALDFFFYAQIAVNGLEFLFCAFLVWGRTLNFFTGLASKQAIQPVLKMTLSLSGLSITALILSQLDKIILSSFIPLDQFGIYSAAYALAMGIMPIAYAIGNASFPAINRYLAKYQTEELQQLIRKSFFMQALLVLPVAASFIFFTDKLEGLFLQFSNDAEMILSYVSLLVIGALVQCFTVLLHGVRLAQGKAKGLFILNLIAVPIFTAGYYAGLVSFGVKGICIAFILFNLYTLCGQIFLHLRERKYQALWIRELNFLFLLLVVSSFAYYFLAWIMPLYGEVMSDLASLVIGMAFIMIGQFLLFNKGAKR